MNKITVPDAVNRGLNFFAISVFGMTGIGALQEFIEEDDTTIKTEDTFFITEALLAVVWYKFSGKALKRTLVPFYFMFAGFLTKSFGLYFEKKDPTTHFLDYGYFGILGMAILIFIYQYYKNRELTKTK